MLTKVAPDLAISETSCHRTRIHLPCAEATVASVLRDFTASRWEETERQHIGSDQKSVKPTRRFLAIFQEQSGLLRQFGSIATGKMSDKSDTQEKAQEVLDQQSDNLAHAVSGAGGGLLAMALTFVDLTKTC